MKIGIIGLGLIGGSILKALWGRGHQLYAVSKTQHRKVMNFTVEAGADLEIIKNCELVFVCSEMSKTLCVLDELENILDSKTIVCDVSSLKGFVENKKRPYNFIGTHPMAGTEFSGFEASLKNMFEGAKWVVTENNKILENIIKEMGATPIVVSAKEHDEAVSLISHLPMLISFGLISNIENNQLAQTLASSGFKDTTRLALTNSTLAFDMLNLNGKNIETALDGLIAKLNYLKNLSDDEKIEELKKISEIRKNIYGENGKNKTKF